MSWLEQAERELGWHKMPPPPSEEDPERCDAIHCGKEILDSEPVVATPDGRIFHAEGCAEEAAEFLYVMRDEYAAEHRRWPGGG